MVLFPPSPSEKSFCHSLVVLIEARSVFKPESSPVDAENTVEFQHFSPQICSAVPLNNHQLGWNCVRAFGDGALMKMAARQYILCTADTSQLTPNQGGGQNWDPETSC